LSFVRFGTGTVSVRAGGTGKLEEEQKRKARAERYMISFYINQIPFCSDLLAKYDNIVLLLLLLLGLGLAQTHQLMRRQRRRLV
jgi:hypothetical protein